MCRREHHVVIFWEYLISTCLEPKIFSKQLLGVDAIWWNATCFHKKRVILLIFWSLTLCLDGWILGRIEKKEWKIGENGWEGCLDERGRGREKWWGPTIFSLGPPQFNLSKMGRKGGRVCWTKLSFSLSWPTFCLFLLLSFSTFVFLLFIYLFIYFCLDKISSSLHNTSTLVWFVFSFFLDKIL